ncbi:unnamed protein product [Parnassius apollo]|uniref:(apollo) hypothetical protein n=1 Tax=Parnassius apollo TaxID=110799 RepID=A0A8S3WYZ0_PARAO|nr:unnamed protein product [Parnassius apollo]
MDCTINLLFEQMEGPSISCIKYDKNKLLTQGDIESILNKINERRNFIALGLSKYLPGAANMKKLVWSDELANFAQRWVDQCDPSTRPDKEDDCRNLGNIHGKPVYAIGYPATQCSDNLLPDSLYKGLCTYSFKNNAIKFTSQSSPVSSLLRIIDFSNSTDWHNKRTNNINIKSDRNSSIISNNTHGKSFQAQFQHIHNPTWTLVSKNLIEGKDISNITGSLRLKRNDKQYTKIKPFWQLDDTLDNKRLQLKANRYTTLSNKIVKKNKQTTLTKRNEHITVKLVNYEHNNKPSPITEKYLSFNELMQLRRINLGGDYDARRQGAIKNDTTAAKTTVVTTATTTATTIATTIASTTEITTNTPFMRIKHCTRKVTCTWTMTKMTDSNGSIIAENGNVNRGSRTPQGYVDGCTRTSTCTRDYMDRNKLHFTKEDISEPNETSEIGDDDYCERRSLNIQRRNPQEGTISGYNYLANLDASMSSFPSASQKENMIKEKSNSDCLCYDVIERMKRDNNINSKIYQLKYLNNVGRKGRKNNYENISYGELYYKILEKIRHMWERNIIKHHQQKCFCKGSIMSKNNILLLSLILCITFMQ